ncbi:PKD domain-containing protein, partial [Candidatus Venteria ishoeyi]|uniref:PKD domain-containing protein n=1 Tax=Candidatus Venteria ishoeyi TaxID=1899563 RepID=UPI0011AFF929
SLSPASGQAPLSVTLNGAAASDPDGDNLTYAWDASGVPIGNGAVSFQHEFAAGDYSITLTVTDPAGLSHQSSQSLSVTAALEPEPLPVSSGLGKAIIITASGAHTNNSLFARSEELTRRMYRALYQRGFEHEDIIWLNPKKWQDIDGDGRDDGVVDDELFDPAQALANAFETMSSLQAGQQFVLHIHGHALQNSLKITRDYWLEATALKTLLDKVPAGVQQLLIVDSCYSGSFLDELAGNNKRIVLTASNAESTAWNAKYANFSDKLINQLRRGQSVKAAFQAAEDMMIAAPELFGNQRPQMDDNGDGAYSSGDGVRAAQVLLGKEGNRAADAPEIIQVHERLNLSTPEGILWVKTSPSADKVRKVRLSLIPPDFVADNYAGDSTDFGRIVLEMGYNSVQDRFEAVYSAFHQAGAWSLLYEAQGLDGTWSEAVAGEVQATGITSPV